MSYRPFGELPTVEPNGGIRYTMFGTSIAFGAISLAMAVFLFVKRWRIKRTKKLLDQKPQRLYFVCSLVFSGLVLALVDCAYAIYVLPDGQSDWSITLAYFGLSVVLYLLLPCCLIHKNDKYVGKGTHWLLILISLMLFLVGLGLTAVFWVEDKPIFEVRVTTFAWNLFAVLIITIITIYRTMKVESQDRGPEPATRMTLAVYFTVSYIIFNAFEGPIPLMMRMFEIFSLVILGIVTFWTGYAIEPVQISTLEEVDLLVSRTI